MEISFRPRTGEELAELDPVALAAQVDLLQVLLITFITAVDEDTMPEASGMSAHPPVGRV